MCKRHSAVFPNQVSSFKPERESGLEMFCDRPKTPFLRTDGERGFVFCDPGKSAQREYGIRSGNKPTKSITSWKLDE